MKLLLGSEFSCGAVLNASEILPSTVRGLDMLPVRSEEAQSFYFDKEKVGTLFYRGLRVATQ